MTHTVGKFMCHIDGEGDDGEFDTLEDAKTWAEGQGGVEVAVLQIVHVVPEAE